MNLNGLWTNVLSAVFSRKPGKIKRLRRYCPEPDLWSRWREYPAVKELRPLRGACGVLDCRFPGVHTSVHPHSNPLLLWLSLRLGLILYLLHMKRGIKPLFSGAGVQNRFCGPQCLQRSQRQQSGFLQLLLYFLQKHVLPLWYSLHNHFHRLCSIQYSFIRAFLLSRNMCSLRMNSK